MTNTKINSAFYPSGVSKANTDRPVLKVEHVYLCQMASVIFVRVASKKSRTIPLSCSRQH